MIMEQLTNNMQYYTLRQCRTIGQMHYCFNAGFAFEFFQPINDDPNNFKFNSTRSIITNIVLKNTTFPVKLC